jgi:hypothetical protein
VTVQIHMLDGYRSIQHIYRSQRAGATPALCGRKSVSAGCIELVHTLPPRSVVVNQRPALSHLLCLAALRFRTHSQSVSM